MSRVGASRVVRGGRVIDPGLGVDAVLYVVIEDGRVT